jgi:glycosyltransferase involved in cell wall biosynthesis
MSSPASQKPMLEFSIVIPTRNRALSARLAIKSALAEAGTDTEVIVSDNSDEPIDFETSDNRLRILRSDTVLSMPDNWERVVRAARGEWVILLSDKCRLVPGALRTLRTLAGSKYSVVTYFRTSFFQELSAAQLEKESEWTSNPGRLIRPSLPLTCEASDSRASLRSWFVDIAYTGKHPMLYNAIVRKEILDRTLDKFSTLFVGMAPDVASSLAILTETDKYLATNLPATIINFPSKQLVDWSNGYAFRGGNKLDKSFTTEFTSNPLARYDLPSLGMAVVLETLLEYYRLRRNSLPSDIAIGWDNFARSATYAIETYYPSNQRVRLHRQVLRSVHADGIKPRALLAQFKALAHMRWPAMYAVHRAITSIGGSRPPTPHVQNEVIECRMKTIDEALRSLASDVNTLVCVEGSV